MAGIEEQQPVMGADALGHALQRGSRAMPGGHRAERQQRRLAGGEVVQLLVEPLQQLCGVAARVDQAQLQPALLARGEQAQAVGTVFVEAADRPYPWMGGQGRGKGHRPCAAGAVEQGDVPWLGAEHSRDAVADRQQGLGEMLGGALHAPAPLGFQPAVEGVVEHLRRQAGGAMGEVRVAAPGRGLAAQAQQFVGTEGVGGGGEERAHGRTAAISSTSTAAPRGSSATPTAARAWPPRAPSTSSKYSLAASITAGCWTKPAALAT